MADGGSDEIVEKRVCGLCSEKYKQPKLLPCFHSYCLECLEKYVEKNVQGNNFDCPLCDTTIEIPQGGVNQFEWNIYLDSRLKSESLEKHDCDLCGPEENATNHCIECEENYCERCSDVHMKQKVSRTHTLLAISDSIRSGTKAIKKKAFCTKHPKEEMKVVCKDCQKMLCLVCKLTDHEKHNTIDIADEAVNVKKGLKESIQKAERSVSKLDKIQESLNAAKAEVSENRYNTLRELSEYRKKLKNQIDKRIRDIEISVNGQFDDSFSNITSLGTDIEKITASLTNITIHADQVIAVADISSLVKVAGKVQKQLEECICKAENHKIDAPTSVASEWRRPMGMISCSLGLEMPNRLTIKTVTKMYERPYSIRYTSDNVSSLSVAQGFCAMSCTYSDKICVLYSFNTVFHRPVLVGYILLCAVEDKIFFSCTRSKLVRVWNKSIKTIADVDKSNMYPHGIAHRFNNGHEELVVCFLTCDDELMSVQWSKGTVKVLPLEERKTPYNFIAETYPAPTRVAISKVNELVCLSYPSIGKISIHTNDGLTIYCFDGKALGISQTFFRPFGVCFDNEDCLVIADRDGGRVLRVNIQGQVIQTLVKGNKPTAVGVGLDDKLWVGYKDINVTMFQMTNKDI